MPTLLLEVGCEELPASACFKAEAQLPVLVSTNLGVEASHIYVTPRRIAFVVDELPEYAAEQLVKGPPASRRDQAAATPQALRPSWPGRPRTSPSEASQNGE